MQDVFAQFLMQEQDSYNQKQSPEYLQKKEAYEKKKKELDKVVQLPPSELYQHYKFEEDVFSFTDFM